MKDYLIYTPFNNTSQRNFTFTSVTSGSTIQSQESMIKGLANTTNQNTNVRTWNDNGGAGFLNAYISKAKLN